MSYLQWLHTRQLQWHSMQAALVEELHIAATSAMMQATMMMQAMNVARGIPKLLTPSGKKISGPSCHQRPHYEHIDWWRRSSNTVTSSVEDLWGGEANERQANPVHPTNQDPPPAEVEEDDVGGYHRLGRRWGSLKSTRAKKGARDSVKRD